jgi:hypothetical protein
MCERNARRSNECRSVIAFWSAISCTVFCFRFTGLKEQGLKYPVCNIQPQAKYISSTFNNADSCPEPEGKRPIGNLGANRMIILKLIFNKYDDGHGEY